MARAGLPPEEGLAFRGTFEPSEALERLVPLYTQHFSVDEMEEMIAFWESEAGRKLREVNPVLARQAAVIGEQYVTEKMAALRRANRAPQ